MIQRMIDDVNTIRGKVSPPFPPAYVHHDDARLLSSLAQCPPIGIVITSPPYPNEKDYTRSTRLESVLLGLLKTRHDVRALKENLLRSNSRNVFTGDDDDTYIADIPTIRQVAEEIEAQRVKLGKTSGFERLYHRVTRLYFGGMYRHFAALFPTVTGNDLAEYVLILRRP
jgi:hypothetical protein